MQRTLQCHICHDPQTGRSHGVVRTPTGQMWQKCPACDGSGMLTPEATKEPAWYPLQLGPVNSGAAATTTTTGQIQIQNEDFEVEALLGTYTSAQLLITILEGGKPWTKSPTLNVNAGTVPIALVVGTASQWMPIYPAYRIRAKEQISITITDQSGANNTLNFALFGKVLRGQATERTSGS